jgi:hypothetical protein
MQGKSKKKGLFLVKVWLGKEDFMRMATRAEQMGFRQVGLPITTQRPHGFADEWRANTNGISQTFKAMSEYYERMEAQRLAEAADIARREQELAREKQQKGLAAFFSSSTEQNKKPR